MRPYETFTSPVGAGEWNNIELTSFVGYIICRYDKHTSKWHRVTDKNGCTKLYSDRFQAQRAADRKNGPDLHAVSFIQVSPPRKLKSD